MQTTIHFDMKDPFSICDIKSFGEDIQQYIQDLKRCFVVIDISSLTDIEQKIFLFKDRIGSDHKLIVSFMEEWNARSKLNKIWTDNPSMKYAWDIYENHKEEFTVKLG